MQGFRSKKGEHERDTEHGDESTGFQQGKGVIRGIQGREVRGYRVSGGTGGKRGIQRKRGYRVSGEERRVQKRNTEQAVIQ